MVGSILPAKKTPGERTSWLTTARSIPEIIKVPRSVILGISPKKTSGRKKKIELKPISEERTSQLEDEDRNDSNVGELRKSNSHRRVTTEIVFEDSPEHQQRGIERSKKMKINSMKNVSKSLNMK